MKRFVVSKKVLWIFISAWIVSLITIVLYYTSNHVSIEKVIVSSISSCFSSIVLAYVLHSIVTYKDRARFSYGYIILAITALYNQNSLTKYVVNSLFDGYITNIWLRLFGSVFVDLIIVLAVYLVNRKSLTKKGIEKKWNKSFAINQFLLLVMILLLIIVEYSTHKMPKVSRMMSTAVQFIRCIVYSAVVVDVKNRENRDLKNKYVFVFLLTLWYVYLTAVSGTKSLVILYLFTICISLYYLDVINIKPLEAGFILSPFLIRGISTVSELASGRMSNFSSEWVLRYHSFRFDLSDLAITILTKPSTIKYGIGIISDAIKFAIPSNLTNVDKDTLLYNGAYRAQMKMIGLQPYDAFGFPEDFNDTLFSVGAQIGGVLGMICLFVAVVLLLDTFSRHILKFRFGYMVVIAMIGMIALVECDMFTLVNTVRDLILVYVVVKFFYWLLSKFSKKQKNLI